MTKRQVRLDENIFQLTKKVHECTNVATLSVNNNENSSRSDDLTSKISRCILCRPWVTHQA